MGTVFKALKKSQTLKQKNQNTIDKGKSSEFTGVKKDVNNHQYEKYQKDYDPAHVSRLYQLPNQREQSRNLEKYSVFPEEYQTKTI